MNFYEQCREEYLIKKGISPEEHYAAAKNLKPGDKVELVYCKAMTGFYIGDRAEVIEVVLERGYYKEHEVKVKWDESNLEYQRSHNSDGYDNWRNPKDFKLIRSSEV